MKYLSEIVKSHMLNDELVFFENALRVPDSPVSTYVAMFERENCFVSLHVRADDAERRLRIEVSSGLRVPDHAYDQAMRYAIGVDYSLKLGQWAINPVNDELVFVIGATFANGGPSRETWGRMMATALMATDEHYPAFVQILFGGRSASDLLPPTSLPSAGVVEETVDRLLRNAVSLEADADSEQHGDTPSLELAIPVRRKRGRPRKHPLITEGTSPAQGSEPCPAPKRGRGRPRIHPLPDSAASEALGTVPVPMPKRGRGRPRIHPLPDATVAMPDPGQKRGRGRPRKNPVWPA